VVTTVTLVMGMFRNSREGVRLRELLREREWRPKAAAAAEEEEEVEQFDPGQYS